MLHLLLFQKVKTISFHTAPICQYKTQVGAFLYKKQERSGTMEALWFVLGFAVTTTVVLATEKLIIKN